MSFTQHCNSLTNVDDDGLPSTSVGLLITIVSKTSLLTDNCFVDIELHDKSVDVVISSCLLSNAVCNPLVLAMVKSPSYISFCFVPISEITFTSLTTKTPVIFTFPVIEPPVSSYLLFNAVCNPSVFAMVNHHH